MMDALLTWLRGGSPVQSAVHDPLRDLIEDAHTSQCEAWEAINRRRRQRGESELPPRGPSWEGLFGLCDDTNEGA